MIMLALFLSSLLLGACDGMARVNVDVDPDTGEGTIDIVGGGETGDESGEEANGTAGDGQVDQGDVQTVVVFATVVALLLGVTAIVISLAKRPRHMS